MSVKFICNLNIPLKADLGNCSFSKEKAHFSSLPLEKSQLLTLEDQEGGI